uniref:Uncharacterized protein n=1 Tax=Arundo donax TaxID=35708 RepID=A0A0A9FZG0_ARUDO
MLGVAAPLAPQRPQLFPHRARRGLPLRHRLRRRHQHALLRRHEGAVADADTGGLQGRRRREPARVRGGRGGWLRLLGRRRRPGGARHRAAGQHVGHGARPQHDVHPRWRRHGAVLGRRARAGAVQAHGLRRHRSRRRLRLRHHDEQLHRRVLGEERPL